ncbi:MAG: hypothetical protein SV775_19025, partial [Thermodesulfobacteriota bacterium]|nr:hypothetical protein [Thermodesulfobacteriota bacterium]
KNGAGETDSVGRVVEVNLINAVDVAGIQVDICNTGDYLSLQSVELTGRTDNFTCDFQDDYPQVDCASLVLYSKAGSVIQQGYGSICILHYDVSSDARAGSCEELIPDNLLITDGEDSPLNGSEDPGEFLLWNPWRPMAL